MCSLRVLNSLPTQHASSSNELFIPHLSTLPPLIMQGGEDVHDIMVLEAKTRINLNELDRVLHIDERLYSWSNGAMKDKIHLKMARYCFDASKTGHG
jgi:hypothetical protein